jgi:hypothetical protein
VRLAFLVRGAVGHAQRDVPVYSSGYGIRGVHAVGHLRRERGHALVGHARIGERFQPDVPMDQRVGDAPRLAELRRVAIRRTTLRGERLPQAVHRPLPTSQVISRTSSGRTPRAARRRAQSMYGWIMVPQG